MKDIRSGRNRGSIQVEIMMVGESGREKEMMEMIKESSESSERGKLARGETKVREGARGGKPLGDTWKFIVRMVSEGWR